MFSYHLPCEIAELQRWIQVRFMRRSDFLITLRYAMLGLAVVILPIVLWKMDLPIVSNTYGNDYEPFELFGFCASIGLIVSAIIELRKQSNRSFERILLITLPVLVGFHFLNLIAEYSIKPWDYSCYERAANAIIAGANPYSTAEYRYPPFVAQAVAFIYHFIRVSLAVVRANMSDESIWGLIYYFYQCGQFFLIELAFFLCYRFARKVGFQSIPALAFVTAMFLFNTPLIRTLRHGQVNLWVLNSVLLATLLNDNYPLIGGLAVALGGHIKLYPLVFCLPWTIIKRWRALLGAAVGFFTIVLIQTKGGQNWHLWHQFLAFFRLFPTGTRFRDNSLYSITHNLLRLTGLLGQHVADLQAVVRSVGAIATLAILAWFCWRFIEREKVFSAVNTGGDPNSNNAGSAFRLYGHLMDALALALLVPPVVWEHHYVLAIPIVLWAIATRWRDKPWQVGIGAFLIFVLPTFDVFPFSYHRLIGLLILLSLTSPTALAGLRTYRENA